MPTPNQVNLVNKLVVAAVSFEGAYQQRQTFANIAAPGASLEVARNRILQEFDQQTEKIKELEEKVKELEGSPLTFW